MSPVRHFLVLFAIALSISVELIKASNAPKCYTCEGINCMRSSKTKEQIDCSSEFDTCVTIFDQSTVAAKGCFTDIPETLRSKCERDDTSECLKCAGDLCNNQGRIKCIVCDTKSDANCNKNINKMTPTQCPLPIATNSYCFIQDDQKGNVKRGCATDLKEQLDCMKDASCSMWMPETNMENRAEIAHHDNPTSGAVSLTFSLGAFAILITINLVR